MKAFLVTVSTLCVCGILLCFWAYATDRLPSAPRVYDMPKATQPTVVAAIPQQVETQKNTAEEDSPCSPCVERMASILGMIEQEWEGDLTSFLEQVATPLTPEARGWEGLSQEQRKQAKAFFDQYGTEEGLRRLREIDPKAARQFERERRESPVHSEPNDEPPTR